MSRFYSNEHVSLDKQITKNPNIIQTNSACINDVYEIEKCTKWIKENNFKRVCLQFPDHLLPDSVDVSFELQKRLNQTIYIMGDTAYESCCVDFIAAEHVDADAIIHFGSICFSQNSKKIPYLNIYENHDIDVELFHKNLEMFLEEKKILLNVLIDTPYIYIIDEIRNGNVGNSTIISFDEDIDNSRSGYYLYVGNNNRKLENILFSLDENHLYHYDPSSTKPQILLLKENPMVLKRRFYLSEKIKDSQTFGIVMGTFAIENYMKVLSRMKRLLKLNKKKYYVISVGKISVEKLANFPEMDMFIVITCAMNEVFENREFYKPLVTPYDVENALNPKSEGLRFTYDYNTFLDKVINEDELEPISGPDVSLLSGKIRFNECGSEENTSVKGEVAVKSDGALIQSSAFGAGYLASRSWKGLEQNLGETEVKLAKEGRSGIPQRYLNEMSDK